MRIAIACDRQITIDLTEDEVVDVYITDEYVHVEAGDLGDDGDDDEIIEHPRDWSGRSGGLN